MVLATGTGKTRVAIGLVELLRRHQWIQRVLFLADRRELVKQALGAFKEHLPDVPRNWIEGGEIDPEARIHAATYPGMMGLYQQLSPGYYDLIICDESHRSIYNRYKAILEHFDAIHLDAGFRHPCRNDGLSAFVYNDEVSSLATYVLQALACRLSGNRSPSTSLRTGFQGHVPQRELGNKQNLGVHRSSEMFQSPSFRQGLPESSHREVNLGAGTQSKSNIYLIGQLPSMALDSGIHAGMTGYLGYHTKLGIGGKQIVGRNKPAPTLQDQPRNPIAGVSGNIGRGSVHNANFLQLTFFAGNARLGGLIPAYIYRSPDGAFGGIRGNLASQSRISLRFIRATVLVF